MFILVFWLTSGDPTRQSRLIHKQKYTGISKHLTFQIYETKFIMNVEIWWTQKTTYQLIKPGATAVVSGSNCI